MPRGAVVSTIVVVAAAMALAGAGCKKKPAISHKAEEALFKDIAVTQLRADSVFDMRDTLKLVRGHWSTPGSTSAYEAYHDSANYRFIEERQDLGEFGSSDNRYYYDPAGAIFFYEDRGEEREPRGSLPPMSRLVQRTMIFAPDGRFTWGRRIVDGVTASVPDSEAMTVAERSRGLVAKVKGMTP